MCAWLPVVVRIGGHEGSPASVALAEALVRERLVIVALGPLTNVAATLRERPELVPQVQAIVFVGGSAQGQALRFADQRRTHFHDRNVMADPAAIAEVLRLRAPLVIIPFDAMNGVRVRADEFALAHTWSDELFSAVQRRKSLWRDRLGLEGFVPFDLVAATWVMQPDLLDCKRTPITVVEPWHAITAFRTAMNFVPGVDGYLALRCAPADLARLRAAILQKSAQAR